MAEIEVNDRRGAPKARSLSQTVSNLRSRGFALPDSPTMARQAAAQVTETVDNRSLVSSMRHTGSMRRSAANTQIAIPKVREPMSSLRDKNIPYDTTKTSELKEIRRWARLFYSTHDLIPLLIDIYSKFPLVGLEFKSKDPQIKDFYESMFMDQLDYDSFLQDLGREYFISGEVNSLAHFDETLGVFSAEEILNPDSINVSKSMFRPQERVQLLVKDMVETLRGNGMNNTADNEETRSEQLEKNWEYQQLVEHYPEIIEAAANDDGLDISDALISRVVNKVQPWDLRGTPHLLRSFRTLLMEESLNAAQDAVADRLYSPFILATLGISDLGDGQPWIPDQTDLDEARDTMQDALAADFRLMVHNFGLKVESVFGRESVPRFDQDYARVDKKLMQAWGIGEALISGSSGGGAYASSALNREFVTQMMQTFQKAVKRHIRKRCEAIAEAQGHFDYELKGGDRKPIFREIVEIDEETGEEYTRKVPKLLLPEITMSTLNLRDEAQERSFLQQLKQSGVPISDTSLAVNIPIEFTEELEKQSEEKVQKLIAEAQAMKKAYDLVVEQGLPIPPDLARYMAAGPQLKQVGTETDTADTEADTAETKQKILQETGVMPGEEPATNIMAPGMPGAIPGADPNMPPGLDGAGGGGDDNPFGGDSEGGGEASADNPFGVDLDNGIDKDVLDNSDASSDGVDDINVPLNGVDEPAGVNDNVIPFKQKLPPRNRTRPEESDEQRKTSPRKSSFGQAPSSYGASRNATEATIESSMNRMSASNSTIRDLVETESFFSTLNRQSYEAQIRSDIDSIYLSLEVSKNGIPRLTGARRDLDESFAVLGEMVDQFEEVYGFRPEW